MSFSALVGKAFTSVITGGASTLGKVAGAAAGQALFGGGSSGQSVGASSVIAGTKGVSSTLGDSDLDKIGRGGLGASGFVRGTIDYRNVGAPSVQAQQSRIADSGLTSIIQSMMTAPNTMKPDTRAALLGTLASPRSVSSNSQSKKFKKYLKGLT
jgi:hypothetical protein